MRVLHGRSCHPLSGARVRHLERLAGNWRLRRRLGRQPLGLDPPVRTVSCRHTRASIRPGTRQCDLWFPGKVVPVAAQVFADPPMLTMVAAYSGFIMALLLPSRTTGDLVAGMWQLLAGLGGLNNGRSNATLARNTDDECSHPIRSAITDAGISGNSVNNRRIAGSNSSTREPCGALEYLGGVSDASADRTVFRANPNRRAIALTAICSERCNRRISAQSSTLITPSL